ncbi:MAG: metalloregulator ArsR/SmtB family transcription factor [Treponema sp.]|jgi:DNA-binding transcriptional ArsR family regulator|nr:metalloregulator ArsR/SmtB family transcription factor [Treponema sp.]
MVKPNEKAPVCDCEVIHGDIVNRVRKRMAGRAEYDKLANLYKMFADGTRVQILSALEKSEMCVCDLAVLLDMTKSAISHQLKSLRLSNLVNFRRDGQVVYYSLADFHVKDILDRGFEHVNE